VTKFVYYTLFIYIYRVKRPKQVNIVP